MSDEAEVKSGVPQGTVMGPPLFTVYIDDIDLFARLAKLFIKFADDGKGMKEIRCWQDAVELQAVLDNLFEWAKLWGMKFNVEKCKIMHIGRNNPSFHKTVQTICPPALRIFGAGLVTMARKRQTIVRKCANKGC
jgi:hypothetical protein